MMLIQDFKIGTEFVLNERRYRCTDVGSRVVVAIRIDQTNVITRGPTGSERVITQEQAEAEGWFNGPPYAVAERVFDENDLVACESV